MFKLGTLYLFQKSERRGRCISDAIYALIEHLQRCNWTIDQYADLGGTATGRIDYDRRNIALDCCNALEAFLTLCHEAGHAMHFDRKCKTPISFDNEEDRPKRETFAYLYGWVVLRQFGPQYADKAKWRNIHFE